MISFFLDAVSKVSKKTIVILVHGRPQTFGLESDRVLSQIDALYAAFRPGEEFGNAMLNLLSGEVNPSAKLSNTWPRSASHTSSNFHNVYEKVAGESKRCFGSRRPSFRCIQRFERASDSTFLFWIRIGVLELFLRESGCEGG